MARRRRMPASAILELAAKCLADDGRTSPKLIEDVRKIGEAVALHERYVPAKPSPDDERRIGRQRTLFAMLADTRATDSLKEAMMQRAYELLSAGEAVAFDAIAEFLPSTDADAIGGAWLEDQDGSNPKSRWY